MDRLIDLVVQWRRQYLFSVFSLLLSDVVRTNCLLLENIHKYEAIYQFGDSISDTGNAIRDPTAKQPGCGVTPYGRTYFHNPSGRCSDGRLMIDFIAQALGLPLLHPYLDKFGNFTHGVNFAVAGSTALNVSVLAAKNITTTFSRSSLFVQLDWFKSHLRTIGTIPPECKSKLQKALFMMGETGGNDYNYAALQGKSTQELYGLVPEVVETISCAIKEVIRLGAKQIIVPGNFPVGCMTIYLAAFRSNNSEMYDDLNCLKTWNDYASFHNDHLQIAIKNLQKEHPDVVITYLDYFSTFRSILKEASSLGFDKLALQKACCGIGDPSYNLNLSRFCGAEAVLSCTNPYERISWDGVHLTQHAYQVMAERLLPLIVGGASAQAV